MTTLTGKRILILEDEPVIAMMLEDILLDLGCEIIGPVSRVEQALNLAKTVEFDAAVLDVNIHGERSYPVASLLSSQARPYVFATGYGSVGLDGMFAKVPVLAKPYRLTQIAAVLSHLFPE